MRYVPGAPPDATPVNQRHRAARRRARRRCSPRHPYQVDAGPRRLAVLLALRALPRRARRAAAERRRAIIDYEDAIGERRAARASRRRRSCSPRVFLLLPLCAIRATLARDARTSSSAGDLLRGARARLHVLRGRADPEADAASSAIRPYSLTVTLFALLRLLGHRQPAERALSRRAQPRRSSALLGALTRCSSSFYRVRDCPASSPRRRQRRWPSAIVAHGRAARAARPLPRRVHADRAPHRRARVTERTREYVAWAWAVNGFFSVIASILATILSMIVGFRR